MSFLFLSNCMPCFPTIRSLLQVIFLKVKHYNLQQAVKCGVVFYQQLSEAVHNSYFLSTHLRIIVVFIYSNLNQNRAIMMRSLIGVHSYRHLIDLFLSWTWLLYCCGGYQIRQQITLSPVLVLIYISSYSLSGPLSFTCTIVATHFEKNSHFDKTFQSALKFGSKSTHCIFSQSTLNLGPTQRTLKSYFKLR